MNIKFTPILIIVLLSLQNAVAHIYLSSVNGNDEFDCIRQERANGDRNAPITDISSGDMTCGWLPYAANPANRALSITAGSNVSLQFYHSGPSPSDFIIESSHRGPCSVYLSKNDGSDPSWWKIWHYGLDSSNKFCVDYLHDNGIYGLGKGKISVRIPTYVPTGKYLLRTEILALHNGDKLGGGQFYINCVELSVTNTATSDLISPSSIPTVKFPGVLSLTDPGIFYNLYQPTLPPYTVPGPNVYQPRSSPSPPVTPVTSSPVTSSPATKAPATSPPVVTAPTNVPVSTGNYISIQIHPEASLWWPALRILGGSESTAKVEFQGSGTYKKGWSEFVLTDYGYWVFGTGHVTLPLSLRLTSVSGKVVELEYVIGNIVGGSVISTFSQYGQSSVVSPSPATTPPTIPPTTPPTKAAQQPTPASTSGGSGLKLKVHAGSSPWWLAVAVTGARQSITSLEVKDSSSNSKYTAMTLQTWGYWTYQGELTAPLSVRVTSSSGSSVVINQVPTSEATIDSSSYI